MVDRLIEAIEDVKMRVQAQRRYDVVHLLTDDACSRSNLLDRLVTETQKGRLIDLVILGHGFLEHLVLKRRPHLRTERQEGRGNTYQAAVPFYTALYPPTVQPTYKTVTVKYPGPSWTEPTRMCEHQVQVPTGVQFRPFPRSLVGAAWWPAIPTSGTNAGT